MLVSSIGLAINLFGMFATGGHAHHGHSHGVRPSVEPAQSKRAKCAETDLVCRISFARRATRIARQHPNLSCSSPKSPLLPLLLQDLRFPSTPDTLTDTPDTRTTVTRTITSLQRTRSTVATRTERSRTKATRTTYVQHQTLSPEEVTDVSAFFLRSLQHDSHDHDDCDDDDHDHSGGGHGHSANMRGVFLVRFATTSPKSLTFLRLTCYRLLARFSTFWPTRWVPSASSFRRC